MPAPSSGCPEEEGAFGLKSIVNALNAVHGLRRDDSGGGGRPSTHKLDVVATSLG